MEETPSQTSQDWPGRYYRPPGPVLPPTPRRPGTTAYTTAPLPTMMPQLSASEDTSLRALPVLPVGSNRYYRPYGNEAPCVDVATAWQKTVLPPPRADQRYRSLAGTTVPWPDTTGRAGFPQIQVAFPLYPFTPSLVVAGLYIDPHPLIVSLDMIDDS